MRRLLLFSALLAPACGTTDRPVSREQVVIAAARPKGTPRKPPEWFEREITAATEDLRKGRLEAGLKRVLDAKEEDPAGADATDLDDLLRRFNRAVLDLPTLVATVEPERDPIAFGDPVRISIRLFNPGTRTVRVPVHTTPFRPPPSAVGPRPVVGSSATLFVLDLVRTEYDLNAHVVSSRRQVHYPLRRDIELPPGATTEIIFTIAGGGNDRPLDGFRTYAVGGVLRPAVVELNGLRRYEAIRLRAGMLRSFRPNYEHLAEDPVGRIRQALEKNAPLHLLTAAALVPPEGRAEAAGILVQSLRGGGPMDLAAFASLSYLTNVDLGNDADAWRTWWSRVGEHYFDTGDGEGPGEGPRFSK